MIRVHGYITIGILTILLLLSGVLYLSNPSITDGAENKTKNIAPQHTGKYVLVNLKAGTVELKDTENTLETMQIVSIGKPGNYYETIGGLFINDYKEPLHFSSIGHVYMPNSVHVFGNFFIHGIPYYPNGTKVSSTYSGGCIRLEDVDAKRVYDFVSKWTPIIITQGDEYDFEPSVTYTPTIENMDMTRLMVASISLEFLTQEDSITGPDGNKTTRLKLLSELLTEKNDAVSKVYARTIGEKNYVEYMNQRAKTLGLTNTYFSSINSPAHTTKEDSLRFVNYIDTYKLYLKPFYNPAQ